MVDREIANAQQGLPVVTLKLNNLVDKGLADRFRARRLSSSGVPVNLPVRGMFSGSPIWKALATTFVPSVLLTVTLNMTGFILKNGGDKKVYLLPPTG